MAYLKNSSEQRNDVTKFFHFFSILMGWTLPSTGMGRGEVFAISDCLVVVCFAERFDVNDVMPYFKVMTSLFTSCHILDIITDFSTSWRNCWPHDEIFDIMKNLFDLMTSLWCHDAPFDVMMYFWSHDVFLMSWQTFWRHDLFLMSWQTLSQHDIFLKLWRTLWRHDPFLTSWSIFRRYDALITYYAFVMS